MKKFIFILALFLSYINCAYATFTQSTIEAEQVAAGTIVADVNASGGQAVTRTSIGKYVSWVSNTTNLPVGSYSLYARMALASSTVGPANFGPQIFYGTTQIGAQNVSINNHTYVWTKITSFNLTQVGGQLRVSDWSSPGMLIDKLAIVQDDQEQAPLVARGTIITDLAASGGRAVTRNTGGQYVWWIPAQTDLEPGDYTVWAHVASVDGNSHNFGSYIVLNNTVTMGPVNAEVSSTAYQWIALNYFTNAGGTQAIRVSDYSDPGLKIDLIEITRRTPYDRMSGAQALFSAGAAALGTRSQVTFNGTPNGPSAMGDPGRVSIVQGNAGTFYAYFRQQMPLTSSNSKNYQIYMSISTDGGNSFNVMTNPIIATGTISLNPYMAVNGPLLTAYDPQVTKELNGNYYMVFEGYGLGCGFSSFSAFSLDGLNWQVQNIPVCTALGLNGSASVPTYFANVENSQQQFIQWTSVNQSTDKAQRYQASGTFVTTTMLPQSTLTFPNSSNPLSFSSSTNMANYALPFVLSTTWDSNTVGATNIYYEDGYYYMVYEGGTLTSQVSCAGQWGLGIMRTATPSIINSWTRSAQNPYLLAGATTSCWLEYPDLVMTPQGLYLYYQNDLINWGTTIGKQSNTDPAPNNLSILRQLILPN